MEPASDMALDDAAPPEGSARALHQLLRERRTIHEFAAGALPQGALERALTAAILAPNHRLTEPWRFIRTGPVTRRALLELGLSRVTRGGTVALPPSARETIRRTIENPAELLVVTQVLDARPAVAAEDYAAIACAVQNMMLALWAEGIGSKWSTTELIDQPETYELLRVDAAGERIRGFLWLGHPAREEPPKVRRKKTLTELLRTLP